MPLPLEPLILPSGVSNPSTLITALGETLETIIGQLPLAVIAVDPDGNVRLWSPGAERMFGFTAQETLGRPLPTIPPEERAEATGIREQSTRRDHNGLRLRRLCKDGRSLHVRLWTTRIVDRYGRTVAMLGVVADDTEQLEREGALSEQKRLLEFLHEIAVAANESSALEPALRRALSLTGSFTGWPLGHALVVDPSGALRSSGLWAVTGPDRFEAFRRDTETRTFQLGEGLPGTVQQLGAPHWILDLEAAANFPRSRSAVECGLKTGLAFPLLVRREVVAVLEFFTEQPCVPGERLLRAMADVGTQLGRIVERARLEREKLLLAEQMRRAEEEAARVKRDSALSLLSLRERQVLAYVARGDDNLKIAAQLGINERTVKAHLSSVLRKLNYENRTQAARFAWELGLDRE